MDSIKNRLKNLGIKNLLKNFGIAILVYFTIIFILVWRAYTISIIKSDPQLASAYVAVGTLILAFVTALLAGFTWLSIRSGDEREKRRKKEALLNEIIEWAEAVANSAIGRQTKDPHELWKTKLDYKKQSRFRVGK